MENMGIYLLGLRNLSVHAQLVYDFFSYSLASWDFYLRLLFTRKILAEGKLAKELTVQAVCEDNNL